MERKDNKGHLLNKGEYQRNTCYEYRYSDPQTGATRSIQSKTLGELRRREKSLREEVSSGLVRKGRTTTLDEAFDLWFDERRKDVAAGMLRGQTLEGYAYLWGSYIRRSRLGRCKVASLTKQIIQDRYRDLLASGLSSGTVETIHVPVSQVVKFACSQGWCATDVSRGAATKIVGAARSREAAEGRYDHPHCLDSEERDALLLELEDERWRHYSPIIRFLLHTGLRSAELCGLLPEDVGDGSVWVRRDLRYANDKRGHMRFVCEAPKNAASRREVPLTEEAKRDFADWRALGKRCTGEADGLTGMVYCKPKGSALTYAAINTELHRIANAANEREGREVIPEGLTCHWLRHTFITEAIDAGVPVQVVSQLVGHDNVETTWKRYYTCRRSTLQAGIDILNRAAEAASGLTLFEGGASVGGDTKKTPKTQYEHVGNA